MEPLKLFNTGLEIRKGEKPNERHFVISTGRADSHRTILKPDNWNIEDYNRAGSVFYQHESWSNDPNMLLGIGRAVKTKTGLDGICEFEPKDINELADTILKKIDFGSMKCTSVGFIPESKGHWGMEADNEDPTLFYFGKTRLLEFSIVNIPSNSDCYKKSMEPFDKYMELQLATHQSEGFKRDYKFRLRQMQM